MSEFWVSKKRYFCKYCDIFIADDAPSRQQHENGLRHKGNKDRFIRGLYKDSEKRKKDKQDEEREMKAIEQAAQAAYAKDVGHAAAAGAIASSSSSAPRPAPAPKGPPSGDKWANYSTAAQLGIVDLEAERLIAETAIRQKEGRVGQWATVALVEETAPATSATETAPSPSQPAKRPREPTPENVDLDDTRRFKVRQKAAVGLGNDIYDPGEIRIKRKDGTTPSQHVVKQETGSTSLQGSAVPEWKPMQWRRPGEEDPSVKVEEGSMVKAEGASEAVQLTEDQANVKMEPMDTPLPAIDGLAGAGKEPLSVPSVKEEAPADEKPAIAAPTDAPGGLFKKRKIKSSTAGGRRPN